MYCKKCGRLLADGDMFCPEFYSVAMGNGHPALKEAADEVAPANIDDGIYRVCEAHGWFEPVQTPLC